jgi:hypothetical protein
MLRPRSLVAMVAIVTLGCLPAFAPNLRAKGVHAGTSASSLSAACMDCHVSEHEALEHEEPAQAPIVADWMLAETRGCVDCHQVRTVARRAARDRLAPLAEVDLAK